MRIYSRMNFMPVVLVCLFLAILANPLIASEVEKPEKFPSRPITIYITYSAGGSTDLSTRVIADAAAKTLGQPIICVNKTGGMGAVAVGELVTKKPDGYTLSNIGTMLVTVVPHMRDLPINAMEDITPIMAFTNYLYAVGVKADAPWKTWEDFRDYAKKNPGKITYGDAGTGNTTHICMEQIAHREGTKWKHVPFKGGQDAIMACLGGHIHAAAASNEFVPHAVAKTFRPLLILSPDRFAAFPDIPTVIDKGYDFSALSVIAFCAPKGLPEGIRKKLEDAFRKGMDAPEFKAVMENLQMPPKFYSGPELVKMWKADFPVKGKILKEIGLAKKN